MSTLKSSAVVSPAAGNAPTTAGREMDALVAEKVMGCVRVHVSRDGVFGAPPELIADGSLPRDHGRVRLPNYSSDMSAAWLVVETLRERRIGQDAMQQVFKLAHCYSASQVAEAICRAALSEESGR